MRIEFNPIMAKPNRAISTCKRDEAFRIGENWYSKIQVSDEEIKDTILEDTDDTFAALHVLAQYEGTPSENLQACLHFGSMSFVYISKGTIADEWASAKIVISAL